MGKLLVKKNFNQQRKDVKKKKKTLQKELSALNKKKDSPEIEQRRKDIHCELADIEKVIGEDGDHGTLALREFQKSVYYDNILAKLHLLVNWPVEKQKTLSAIQSGEIKKEKFSDVKDIGARGGGFNDQSKDIDIGKQAWEEAIKNGDIREDEIVKDSEVIEYFEKLLKNIETDVKVPLKLFVINKQMTREPFVGEPEINAFALPGGILAVETGLIAYSERVMNLAKQSVYLKSLNLKNVEELTIDSSDFQKVRAKVRDLIEKEKEKMKKDSANVKRPTLSRKSKTPCPQN